MAMMKSKKSIPEKRLANKTSLAQGLRKISDEIESIGSIELAVKATSVLEKFLWMAFFVFGIGWLGYFLREMIEDENPKTSIRMPLEINDLDYPAMTFCSEMSTKYAIAEKLGNMIDTSKELPVTLQKLRSNILSKQMDDYSKAYKPSCVNHPKPKYCEVILNFC